MSIAVGERAPAFRLPGVDNAYWILGEPDERQTVLIVFFRREVASCRLLLTYVERLHRRAKRLPSEIFGVSMDNHRDTLELAQDFCLTFPIMIESERLETFRTYRVSGIPTLISLDQNLEVVDSMIGWSKERFERIAIDYLRMVDARHRTLWDAGDDPPELDEAMRIGGLLRGEEPS